jgi:pyruvate-ferredoxin/flavodoxin oxidoreductase
MMQHRAATMDGNEAAARVAHLTNEVIAIYPITPSSPMGELADHWSAQGVPNLWGAVPRVVEMQSEAGAAGVVHGALQTGALAATFTSSQGLLLMLPNMYKIAGELTPFVMHVAARAVAAQGLSIFGDHGDVMAARSTGFAMIGACSVQEAMDIALIAQAASLESRVPFVHFFDGFRTSHEVAKIEAVSHETVRAMIRDELVHAHRARALNPERPVIRGTSQNPDVYFQARETVNPYYLQLPGIVQGAMDRFAQLTGRQYGLCEYTGAPDADRVIVLMGSGAQAAGETVEHLIARGERVGVLTVRLFRPFPVEQFLAALPASVEAIAVLDRCKEPGADGEPLYKDVATALLSAWSRGERRLQALPRVIGGRYGLGSKEFTPGMVKAVFDELAAERPRAGFTVGIVDDCTGASLEWDPALRTDAGEGVLRAVFFGLGSDGTVGANKNTIHIVGDHTERHVQGYFVYDSRKAGAVTVSHLRFAPHPIRSSYLIGRGEAHFVACHQTAFLERYDMLDYAAPGAVFLLNTSQPPERVWESLPRPVQEAIIGRGLRLYAIDAYAVARAAGVGGHINTVMQTCFFAISGLLPRAEAIEAIKASVRETYGKKGAQVVERNCHAIDAALANLHEIPVPAAAGSVQERSPAVPQHAPRFVREVLAPMMEGRGDSLPVSLLPADGTYPTGTAAWDKRNLAHEIPVWEPSLCIFCGKCVFVCPHTAIRSKAFAVGAVADAPSTFKHAAVKGKEFEPGTHMTYQVAPEDCTGCTLCVDVCPAVSKSDPAFKALNMRPQAPLRAQEAENWSYFLGIPEHDRAKVRRSTIKGAMLYQPLFEFPSACVGCGETPYIRLATQLFGDRMLIANATGCSSIYGGNLPTTPYTTDAEGRGPAWCNSLFEDNAEFGLGMRLAVDQQGEHARALLRRLGAQLGVLANELIEAEQESEEGIRRQRARLAELRTALAAIDAPEARALESVADALVRRSVWIIGGDGWAYDIGFGGLDHVLASGADVNVLVLDTEVYSNTGGQASKATPLGASARFASGGKTAAKKDMARHAMGYGNVYVATVAYGAKDMHTLRVFQEAEAYRGPSLIIAYSPCVEHGYDLSLSLRQQELAIKTGHWDLMRYDPRLAEQGKNPLQLDSKAPTVPYREFVAGEARFRQALGRLGGDSEPLLERCEAGIAARRERYERMADAPQKEEEER